MDSKSRKGIPAGCELSDSEDDYYDELIKPQKIVVKAAEKSPREQMKERLLVHLKNNDKDAIQEELDHGPVKGFDIDEHLDSTWNILFYACSLGSSELVKYLVEVRGACINRTANSETPLMVACYSKADSEEVLKIVKILVNESTNIRVSNSYGVTALMFACSSGHIEVVKYLLSLNDAYDARDNDGNNSLFHAIDGKQVKIAKILIDAGIDLSASNRTGYTAKHYAMNENQQEIVNLFPQESLKYETPSAFMNYNRFEDLVPGLENGVPAYFQDVITLLRGMNCEKFVPKFAEAGISLEEFLTISDDQLKEIRIEMPFEQDIVQLGIYKFHKEKWNRNSLFIPNLKEDLSSLDLVMILANILRQLVIIKSHLVYMKQMGEEFELDEAYKYLSVEPLNEFKANVKVLRNMIKKESAGLTSTRPLLITKKKKKQATIQSKFVKLTVFAAVPLIIIAAFKVFNN